MSCRSSVSFTLSRLRRAEAEQGDDPCRGPHWAFVRQDRVYSLVWLRWLECRQLTVQQLPREEVPNAGCQSAQQHVVTDLEKDQLHLKTTGKEQRPIAPRDRQAGHY